MNNAWITRKLGDITKSIGSGATPKGGKSSYKKSGISLIRSLNVHDGEFRKKNLAFIDESQAKKLQNVVVNAGDVLLNITGASVARCCMVPDKVLPARVNQHVSIVRPDSDVIDSYFLHYLLVSPKYKNKLLSDGEAGATRQALTKGGLKEFSVCFPPSVQEQRRIVAILDEAFAEIATAKANTEKNLQNAHKLFESYLHEIFARTTSYECLKAVGDIAEKSLGKMLDKKKNRGKYQPYLRNLNVRWFHFDLSDLSEMRFLENEEEKYSARKGDVMICEGGYPGRAAIWNEDYSIKFQKAIHRVRFADPIIGRWFVYFLYAKHFSGELKAHFTGAGIQHFTGKALGRFRFPVPSIRIIQRSCEQIDSVFTETNRLQSVYQKKLAALDELKSSLLDLAFSGNL